MVPFLNRWAPSRFWANLRKKEDIEKGGSSGCSGRIFIFFCFAEKYLPNDRGDKLNSIYKRICTHQPRGASRERPVFFKLVERCIRWHAVVWKMFVRVHIFCCRGFPFLANGSHVTCDHRLDWGSHPKRDSQSFKTSQLFQSINKKNQSVNQSTDQNQIFETRNQPN